MAQNMSLADQAVQALAMVQAMDDGMTLRTRNATRFIACGVLLNRRFPPGFVQRLILHGRPKTCGNWRERLRQATRRITPELTGSRQKSDGT